jgi:hypothetical protein
MVFGAGLVSGLARLDRSTRSTPTALEHWATIVAWASAVRGRSTRTGCARSRPRRRLTATCSARAVSAARTHGRHAGPPLGLRLPG